MKPLAALLIGLAALALPDAAAAQGRGKADDIPAGSRPPAGMCRIWLDNVPAARQPAPTDCASAVRNRPAKGRVIFGDDYLDAKRRDSTSRPGQPVKGFAPGNSDKKKSPVRKP